MDIKPFPYPVPPRRGVTTGHVRLINGQSYRTIFRCLLLLIVMEAADLLMTLAVLMR